MKNFAEKIKTFFVSHKIVSIASASVLAVAIIAGVSVGVMMNKNNKIDTKDGSSFEATGSFTTKGDKKDTKDSKDNKDSSKTDSSSSDSTSSATSSVASPDTAQTESKTSDPAYTQTPAGTKQNNNKGTATSGNRGNKGTTNKTPATSSSSTPSTAPSQPSAPATPSQPSGGSTGGSTTVNPNTTSSDISAGTQMGQAIASGIDTSDINLPKDEQGRFICQYCGKPKGNGHNGTCIRVIVRLDENFNEVRECNHYD